MKPTHKQDPAEKCVVCGHFKPHWRHQPNAKKHYHTFEAVTIDENVGRALPVPADTLPGGERNNIPGANEASETRLPPTSISTATAPRTGIVYVAHCTFCGGAGHVGTLGMPADVPGYARGCEACGGTGHIVTEVPEGEVTVRVQLQGARK
jgi:hypothetical protein